MTRRWRPKREFGGPWSGCGGSTKWQTEMNGFAETFQDKTVLVTGGGGAIGTNLVRALSGFDPERVVILDNLSSSYEWNVARGPKVRFLKGDIVDAKDVEEAFKDHPQIVYHLAAHFANQNSVDHPELDLMVNGMGILKVLERARKSGVERLIYASSGC